MLFFRVKKHSTSAGLSRHETCAHKHIAATTCTYNSYIHPRNSFSLYPNVPMYGLAQAFIHGIENNPVAALAQELGLTLVPMDDCKLLNRQGQPVPEAMDQ